VIKLIALELLFKYSAYQTPTPKLTSNEQRELETHYFINKTRRRLGDALLRRMRKQSCDGDRMLFERHWLRIDTTRSNSAFRSLAAQRNCSV